MQAHRLLGDPRRHVRVPVAVSAHPGAETEERTQRKVFAGIRLRQRVAEIAVEARYGLPERTLEVIQIVADLVEHRRRQAADLVGVPQRGDLLAQERKGVLALARRER